MKTKFLSLLLIFCLLCGCSSRQVSGDAASGGFVDDLGRTVTVSKPQRVACLLGSFAQVWQLAGGEVAATADDAWDDLNLNCLTLA